MSAAAQWPAVHMRESHIDTIPAQAADRAVVAALLRLAAIPKDDWEECLQQVLQVDSEVLGVGRVSYWSLRHDPTSLHCEMGYVAGAYAYERGMEILEAQHPLYFRALFSLPVIEVQDVAADPRTADMMEYLRVRAIVSMLDIPVWCRGELAGLLRHEHTGQLRTWTTADLEFCTAVGQVVVAALEAHARGEAERLHRCSAFLDRASRSLAGAHDVAEVAQRAVRCAVPEIADWAVLDVLDGSNVQRAATWHRSAEGRARLDAMSRRFPPYAGSPQLTTRAMELRQSLLIPEIERVDLVAMGLDRDQVRMIRELDTCSSMAAPLVLGDRVLGAVVVSAATSHFRQADLRLVEEFAVRVAQALENARLHRQAKSAIAARDEFMALAAHELHGPLASLQLAAESLATRADTSSAVAIARMSETIVRQTRRLNRLVDHMLDASRAIANRLVVLAPESVDLGALARELAQSFAERLEQAGSTLELQLEEPLVGEWDADRLSQVIGNLLDNAIKLGSGKPVTLTLRKQGAQAVLVVRDRGIGIAPEQLATIFEPFERAVSPRSFGGLGLGLFTAKAIVQAHGGSIGVESRAGEGSTFTVRLPLDAARGGATQEAGS